MTTKSLSILPVDLIAQTYSYLPISELPRFYRISHKFQRAVDEAFALITVYGKWTPSEPSIALPWRLLTDVWQKNDARQTFIQANLIPLVLKTLQCSRNVTRVLRAPLPLSLSDKKLEKAFRDVLQDFRSLQQIHPSSLTQGYREVVLAAVLQNGWALQFADAPLRGDRKIVLAALTSHAARPRNRAANLLEYILAIGMHEYDMANITALQDLETKNPHAFGRLSDSLGYGAIGRDPFGRNPKATPLSFADDSLKRDRAFVLKAVQRDGCALAEVDAPFQSDREIVVAAVEQNSAAMQYYRPETSKDEREKTALAALKRNGRALEFVPRALRHNPELVFAAVKQDGYALRYANHTWIMYRDIVLAAVQQNGLALQYAGSLQDDSKRDIVLAAVQQNGLALQYAPTLQDDSKLVRAAIQQNPGAYAFASPRIKQLHSHLSLFLGSEDRRASMPVSDLLASMLLS